MSSSVEALWLDQAQGRARLRKLALIIISAFGLTLLALWFWLTQPILLQSRAAEPPPVDPSRLQIHVRKLSEQFFPRDSASVENLELVAAYIRGEFESA